MTKLSVVVPFYNEQENVEELHREINEVCIMNNYIYEIIFIDDGSTDHTFDICSKLKPIRAFCMRRNFGQTAAMDLGIKSAKYPYIITMDGDRQNDPKDIPNLIKHLESGGYDVVSGWRKNRKDNFFKKITSRGANLLRKILIDDGIQDSGCSLKIYKKECFEHISLYGEMHRFIPALLKIKGFRTGEVVVNHRPRVAGVTKYNWKRTLKGLVDMVSVWFWNKYAVRPLHLLGGMGLVLVLVLIGSTTATIGFGLYVFDITLLRNFLPLFSAFSIMMGIQFFIFGLMADMLSKSYYETTKDTPYTYKKEVINGL